MTDEQPLIQALEPPASSSEVHDWMVNYIASVINVPMDSFPADKRFDHIGLDSVEVAIMAGMIEEQFGLEMDLESIFENPNVNALSAYISKGLAQQATSN
jgi:acyl carrier protein